MQNNRLYSVQGHSRPRILVPMESAKYRRLLFKWCRVSAGVSV